MVPTFINQICDELGTSVSDGLLHVGAERVSLSDLEPGVAMRAVLCETPEKREEVFEFAMRANLLGQGTGGARIGLSEDEKFLTLSLELPYELNYKVFREQVELFVNYLITLRADVCRI